MSADRQRLVSAIRRIAKTGPEISSALSSAGVRGDQPAASGVGISSGSDSRICCGDTGHEDATPSNQNPGTSQRDTGGAGGSQAGGFNNDDPASLNMGSGQLSGVTDCATNQPICFDGSDWIPPDEWSSPTDPPKDPTYQEGSYWRAYWSWLGPVNDTTAFALSEEASCDKSYALFLDAYPSNPNAGGCVSQIENCDPDQDGTVQSCNPDQQYFDEISAESWPADGCTSLAARGGAIVGSRHDPENNGSYNLPRNGIELCDGEGNSILLEATEAGGWRSIKSLGGEPDPDTVGYEYNGRGEIVRVMSTGEWKATGQDPRNF